MGWLERRIKEREKEAKKWKIRPGDFVNLSQWFGDVWAEVVQLYDCDSSFIVIAVDNPHHTTSIQHYSNIRKLCRRENIDKIKTCHIIMKDRTIKRVFPMDANAYRFQGDEHITEP